MRLFHRGNKIFATRRSQRRLGRKFAFEPLEERLLLVVQTLDVFVAGFHPFTPTPFFEHLALEQQATLSLEYDPSQTGVQDGLLSLTGLDLPLPINFNRVFVFGGNSEPLMVRAATSSADSLPDGSKLLVTVTPTDFWGQTLVRVEHRTPTSVQDGAVKLAGEFPEPVDIAATTLDFDDGTVTIGWDITGGTIFGAGLPIITRAFVFWSNDAVLGNDRFDSFIPIDGSLGTSPGSYQRSARIGFPIPGETHLILVVDGNNLIEEDNESNNVLIVPLNAAEPDIEVLDATTTDSQSVTFTYEVTGNLSDFQVGVFRSADDHFSAGDVSVGNLHTVSNTEPGEHTLQLQGALPPDPSRPYVLVVADPANAIEETDEDNNTASFRKHVIAAITHGLIPTGFTPGWIIDMGEALVDENGYEDFVTVDWAATSNNLEPGRAVVAGFDMAKRVANAVEQLSGPGDIVDVHFIGHSRGAVVISEALQNLEENEDVRRGFVKITMLDPHPAHSVHSDQTSTTV